MLKRLTLLLTAAMLVFALTACGSSNQSSGQDQGNQPDSSLSGDNTTQSPDMPTTQDSMTNPNKQDGLADDVGDTLTNGLDDVTDALDGAGDALTGNKENTTGGVSYEDMLRNARVHDRDGDLTDYENSVSRNLF